MSWVKSRVYNIEKVNNCAVTTVEGIGAKKGDLQAIQNEMINTDGSQCGFCTPGMIMTMYTVIRNYKKITNKQLHQALQGNLCRCTGYRPIWQAFKNTKERSFWIVGSYIHNCSWKNIRCFKPIKIFQTLTIYWKFYQNSWRNKP